MPRKEKIKDPWVEGRKEKLKEELHRGETYHAHACPRFSEVHKEVILCPLAGSGDFLEREIGTVLREVDLGSQGYAMMEHRRRSVKCGGKEY